DPRSINRMERFTDTRNALRWLYLLAKALCRMSWHAAGLPSASGGSYMLHHRMPSGKRLAGIVGSLILSTGICTAVMGGQPCAGIPRQRKRRDRGAKPIRFATRL